MTKQSGSILTSSGAIAIVAITLLTATGAVLYMGSDEPTTVIPSVAQQLDAEEEASSLTDIEVQQTGITATACYTGVGAFEPTIMGTGEGQLFMQANVDPLITATTGVDSPGIVRSDKACDTWTDVSPTFEGLAQNPPNSNDPYVHVDDIADRVFKLEMQGLQCNYLTFSDDLGDTWTSNPLGCGHPAGVQDHPTIFTGPPANAADAAALSATGHPTATYICANQLTHKVCAKSLDGGLSFGPWRALEPKYEGTIGGCISGITAHGTTGPDGTIYIGGLGGPSCVTPFVASSQDGGLTWQGHVVTDQVSTRGHEIATAVDDDGTVYAFWISRLDRPFLAYSTDKGDTWSDPIDVGTADLGDTALPTIEAGASGDVAFAYIASRDSDGAVFDAHMGIALDVTGSSPDVRTTTVNPSDDPIARGSCEPGNKWCSIGDFIDITIDDDGRPWAAFVDVCTGACANGFSDNNDVAAFAGTLTSGPSLVDGTELGPLSS